MPVKTENSSSAIPSLRSARITLFLGLLLFFAAHAVPVERVRMENGFAYTYIGEIWPGLWKTISQAVSRPTPNANTFFPLVDVFVFVSAVLLLLALPFLVAFLHRARAFLWIARLILVSIIGFHIVDFVLYRIELHAPSSDPSRFAFLPGFWLLIASLALDTLGLFLIPRLPSQVARS